MLSSKLTQKGQATITKIQPFDSEYHATLGNTLSEWNSKTDDEAYGDL